MGKLSEAEVEEGLDVAAVQLDDHLHDNKESKQLHKPWPMDELGFCMTIKSFSNKDG